MSSDTAGNGDRAPTLSRSAVLARGLAACVLNGGAKLPSSPVTTASLSSFPPAGKIREQEAKLLSTDELDRLRARAGGAGGGAGCSIRAFSVRQRSLSRSNSFRSVPSTSDKLWSAVDVILRAR
eukprot:g2509.t1